MLIVQGFSSCSWCIVMPSGRSDMISSPVTPSRSVRTLYTHPGAGTRGDGHEFERDRPDPSSTQGDEILCAVGLVWLVAEAQGRYPWETAIASHRLSAPEVVWRRRP